MHSEGYCFKSVRVNGKPPEIHLEKTLQRITMIIQTYPVFGKSVNNKTMGAPNGHIANPCFDFNEVNREK